MVIRLKITSYLDMKYVPLDILKIISHFEIANHYRLIILRPDRTAALICMSSNLSD